jgi:hypothetical protein
VDELAFLTAWPKVKVVDILQKHIDDDKIQQGLRLRGDGLAARLFEKAVMDSDIVRLNRLVVPKVHVEKQFSPLSGSLGSR